MKLTLRASSSQWSFRPCLTVLFLMIAATPGFAQTRAPVPPADKQKEIAKLLEQTYNLAKLDSAAKKQDAVKRLVDASRNASFEAEERYVVLTTLIKLATETGDAANWLEAVNTLVTGFEVDAQKEKTRLLTEFLSASKSGLLMKPAIDEAIAMSRAAAKQNRYADATTLLGAAETAVQRATGASNLKPLIAEARQAIAAQEKDWKTIQAANAKLATNPEDPAANFTVGRWHVLQSGDWKTALPFLTKASNTKWKAAALLEKTEPTDATAQAAIGDAWYDIAQNETGVAKTAVLARAGRWYEAAQPNLTSALKKQLVAKRLEEITPPKPATPITPEVSKPVGSTPITSPKIAKAGEWIDLLEWTQGVDWAPRGIKWNDYIEGEPTRDGLTLKSARGGRFPLPAIIEGDYELEVEFTRHDGGQAVGAFFPVGMHNLCLEFGALSGALGGVGYIDGKWIPDNPTARRPSPISNHERHQFRVRVRSEGTQAAFQVDWDQARNYIQWEGASELLADVNKNPQVSLTRHPWLVSYEGRTTFHRARVRMLSGTIRRDVITDVDREQDLKSGFVRLVGETAISNPVAHGQFLVNQVPMEFSGAERHWPLITRDFKFCEEFYGAHAPSRLKCPIPKEAKSFSVIGYNDASRKAKFQVYVDGNKLHDTGETAIAIIKVDIPAKSSLMELVVDPGTSSDFDHAYWCFPRFHPVAAERVVDKMLDGKSGVLKFSVASGNAEHGMTQNQPIGPLKSIPIHFRDLEPCDEFLFAHAPSTVTYRLPQGVIRFSAIGYNVWSHSVKFEVWADAKRIYQSPEAGVVEIDVKLPVGAKTIELKIDDLGRNHADASIWCYPRLHRK